MSQTSKDSDWSRVSTNTGASYPRREWRDCEFASLNYHQKSWKFIKISKGAFALWCRYIAIILAAWSGFRITTRWFIALFSGTVHHLTKLVCVTLLHQHEMNTVCFIFLQRKPGEGHMASKWADSGASVSCREWNKLSVLTLCNQLSCYKMSVEILNSVSQYLFFRGSSGRRWAFLPAASSISSLKRLCTWWSVWVAV